MSWEYTLASGVTFLLFLYLLYALLNAEDIT